MKAAKLHKLAPKVIALFQTREFHDRVYISPAAHFNFIDEHYPMMNP